MIIQPVILAAGKGTRMNNPEIPKVLVPIVNNKPIISFLLDNLENSGFAGPILVVGYHQEKVREYFGNKYTYVTQEEQLGTGHALSVCRPDVEGNADILLVMNGDHPLWTLETMRSLIDEHVKSQAVFSLVTLVTDHEAFQNFGRIIRDDQGHITGIREFKDCTDEEKAIQEVNPALYCFDNRWVWQALTKLTQVNAQHEFYITDLLAIAVEEGKRIGSVPATSWQETLGINTPEQLEEVKKWI